MNLAKNFRVYLFQNTVQADTIGSVQLPVRTEVPVPVVQVAVFISQIHQTKDYFPLF